MSDALVLPERRSWLRFFRSEAPPAGPVQKRSTLTIDGQLFESWLRKPGASGVVVTSDLALRVATVFGCVRVISETAGSIPLLLYRRLDRGKERAAGERLYTVLHDLPNPETTSAEFWEYLIFCAALHGNGFAQIVLDNAGRVHSLWQLQAKFMRVERNAAGALLFHYSPPSGAQKTFSRDQILWIRGPSKDGVTGMAMSEEARDAIGLAAALEDFGARFFGNSAVPSGILNAPGTLDDPQRDRLTKAWEDFHRGENQRRTAVVEGGMTYTPIGVVPEEGQMLESRLHQVAEICGIFRVPPHKVARLDKATFSNIEHQSIEFVTDTMRPWLVRAEKAIFRDVLTEEQRPRLFAEFLVDGLLRGDFATRTAGYAVARVNGWMSANEIRALENMNPRPDHAGDEYLTPMNMIQSGTAEGAPGPGIPSPRRGKGVDDASLGTAFLPLYRAAVERVVKAVLREFGAVKPETREAWEARTASSGFRAVLELAQGALEPVALAHVLAARPEDRTSRQAALEAVRAAGDELVRAAWPEAFGRDPARALEQLLADWVLTRASTAASGVTRAFHPS